MSYLLHFINGSQTHPSPTCYLLQLQPHQTHSKKHYPIWLSQVIPHLKGGNLFRYVDGFIPCSPPYITTVKEHISSTTTNSASLHRKMQDQIILGFLTSTILEKMISHVARYTTSNQAWTKLETLLRLNPKHVF